MGNEEKPKVKVDEVVILQKFDGDTTDPDAEVERLTIKNGYVVSHDAIEKGEVVGPVEKDNLSGKDVGTLLANSNSKEVE